MFDFDEKIDVKKLLDNIYFAEEDVVRANLKQAKLMFAVSRYHVQAMRKRMQIKTKLDLVSSQYALHYRRRMEGKPTEGAIKERYAPKVYRLVKKLNQALIDEELAKCLYECYKQRQLAIANIFKARNNETARALYKLETESSNKKLRDAAKFARSRFRERDEDA